MKRWPSWSNRGAGQALQVSLTLPRGQNLGLPLLGKIRSQAAAQASAISSGLFPRDLPIEGFSFPPPPGSQLFQCPWCRGCASKRGLRPCRLDRAPVGSSSSKAPRLPRPSGAVGLSRPISPHPGLAMPFLPPRLTRPLLTCPLGDSVGIDGVSFQLPDSSAMPCYPPGQQCQSGLWPVEASLKPPLPASPTSSRDNTSIQGDPASPTELRSCSVWISRSYRFNSYRRLRKASGAASPIWQRLEDFSTALSPLEVRALAPVAECRTR